MKQPAGYLICICGLLILCSNIVGGHRRPYRIPAQKLRLYNLIGNMDNDSLYSVEAFDISRQVTFAEYKIYLASVQQDSPIAFYLKQLPDSNMVPDRKVYLEYINSRAYDHEPVLGISWENAMNYCRWLSLRHNYKDSLRFIYRLPHLSEWLAANHFLEKEKRKHDFNHTYSDWLITSMYNNFNSKSSIGILHIDDFYPHVILDHMNTLTLKRKFIIGNSYRRRTAYPMEPWLYSYSDKGSREVGFRFVKEQLVPGDSSAYSTPNKIIKYWGLKK